MTPADGKERRTLERRSCYSISFLPASLRAEVLAYRQEPKPWHEAGATPRPLPRPLPLAGGGEGWHEVPSLAPTTDDGAADAPHDGAGNTEAACRPRASSGTGLLRRPPRSEPPQRRAVSFERERLR